MPKPTMTEAEWRTYLRRVSLRRVGTDRWHVLLNKQLTRLTVTREAWPFGSTAWHITSPAPQHVSATTFNGLTAARWFAGHILAGSPDIVSSDGK